MKTKKYDGDVKEILRVCDEFNEAYKEVELKTVYYVMQQKSLKSIADKNKEFRSLYMKLDENLFASILASLVQSLVLSSSTHIASFLKEFEDEFSASAIEKLNFWKKNPFFWMAFKVEQMYGDDLFDVIDVFTGEKYLLRSHNVKEVVFNYIGAPLIFFSTVYYNTECVVPIEGVAYTEISPQNIAYILSLSSVNNGKPVTKELLSRVVYRNYFLVSLITLLQDREGPSTDQYDLKYCFSIHQVSEDSHEMIRMSKQLTKVGSKHGSDVYHLKSIIKSIKNKFLEKFPDGGSILKDMMTNMGDGILRPNLYYKRSNHTILIESMSPLAYQVMRFYVESIIDLPMGDSPIVGFEPAIQDPAMLDYSDVTMLEQNLFVLLYDYVDRKKLPWVAFTGSSTIQEVEGKFINNSYEKETIDAFSYIHECAALGFYKEEEKIDAHALAVECDVPIEIVNRIIDKTLYELENGFSHSMFNLADSFLLHRIPIFTPSFRQRLRIPLGDNNLFSNVSKDNVKALELMKMHSSQEMQFLVKHFGFLHAIGSLAQQRFYGDTANAIISTILYILSIYPGEWVSVFDMSVKIVSTFETSFIHDYDDLDEILDEIIDFILSTVVSAGLVSIGESKEGETQVKTTDFFTSIILLQLS